MRPPVADGRGLRRQVERLREIPTFPGMIDRILAALDRPEASLTEAAALIESDQALTAQLLRLANSAFYGLSGTIGTVTRALTVLGTTVTRSLLFSTTVFDAHVLHGFWEHSIGTAIAAAAIARHLGLPHPAEVSGAGLLHDIGKVVLFREAPEAFAAVLARAESRGGRFLDAERELLGIDHTEIAGWLLPRWRLPVRLVEPVLHHHDPVRATVAPRETAVVHLANTLVRGHGYGFAGDRRVPAIAPVAWERLGLGPADLDAIIRVFARDLRRAQESGRFDGV